MKDINIIGEVSRDKAIELFKHADIFTAHNRVGPLTKREEAFGVCFIEAMSAGLPVIAGRSGGVPEIVLDGKTGYLIDQNDVESHANKLADLVNNPDLRKKMGEAGRLRVAEKFSLEQEKASIRKILGLNN
jgi:phosphatidylinositol alpha-1,6-mannosyltransferase